MEVLGAGVLPRTSREEKSVWVVSEEGGPRSWDAGGRERVRWESVMARVVGSRCGHGVGREEGERRKVRSSWIVGRAREGERRSGGIFAVDERGWFGWCDVVLLTVGVEVGWN